MARAVGCILTPLHGLVPQRSIARASPPQLPGGFSSRFFSHRVFSDRPSAFCPVSCPALCPPEAAVCSAATQVCSGRGGGSFAFGDSSQVVPVWERCVVGWHAVRFELAAAHWELISRGLVCRTIVWRRAILIRSIHPRLIGSGRFGTVRWGCVVPDDQPVDWLAARSFRAGCSAGGLFVLWLLSGRFPPVRCRAVDGARTFVRGWIIRTWIAGCSSLVFVSPVFSPSGCSSQDCLPQKCPAGLFGRFPGPFAGLVAGLARSWQAAYRCCLICGRATSVFAGRAFSICLICCLAIGCPGFAASAFCRTANGTGAGGGVDLATIARRGIAGGCFDFICCLEARSQHAVGGGRDCYPRADGYYCWALMMVIAARTRGCALMKARCGTA